VSSVLPDVIGFAVTAIAARDAKAADEALDARLAAASATPTGARTAETVWERPWWETDASVFGDRAPSFGDRIPRGGEDPPAPSVSR
jgi:hypothetical protein